MTIDKQKELIEIRKLYLTQFEKFETRVFLSWSVIVLLPLFVLWTQGKLNGWLVLIVALFTCGLDLIIELWRKKNYNKLIKDINTNQIGEI